MAFNSQIRTISEYCSIQIQGLNDGEFNVTITPLFAKEGGGSRELSETSALEHHIVGDRGSEALGDMLARARMMAITIHTELIERTGVAPALAKSLAKDAPFH